LYSCSLYTTESFLLPKKKKKKKKKKFVRWDWYKCLELKKETCDHNKFKICSKELGNEELSEDSIVEKFITTTNSTGKGFIDYIFNRNQKSDV